MRVLRMKFTSRVLSPKRWIIEGMRRRRESHFILLQSEELSNNFLFKQLFLQQNQNPCKDFLTLARSSERILGFFSVRKKKSISYLMKQNFSASWLLHSTPSLRLETV